MHKIKIVLALAILLVAVDIFAQAQPPVAFVSGPGKIKYKQNGKGRYLKVYPGAVIRNTSLVKVKGSSPITVYCDGSFKQIKSGKHNLSSAFETGNAMRRMGFDNTFSGYVEASLSLAYEAVGMKGPWASFTDPRQGGDGWGVKDGKKSSDGWGVKDKKKSSDGWGVKDKKKSSDGWGVKDKKKSSDGWGVKDKKKSSDGWGVKDKKKSSDGWGGLGNKINLILPFGKVVPGATTFSWSKPAGVSSYQLEITDGTGKVVHEATVRDTFAQVNLAQKPFANGSHYLWKITGVEKDLASEPFEIEIAPVKDSENIFRPLERSEIYASGDPALKGLMEAVLLERNDRFVQASEKYASLKRSYPKNKMVRLMYATFWMRYDMLPKANAAVE